MVGVGWIGAIVLGGVAGCLAEHFMKSNMGMFTNISLVVVGAAIASFLFGLLGIGFAGLIGYLIAGFAAACILISVGRTLQRS